MEDIRSVYKVILISSAPSRTLLVCYVSALDEHEAIEIVKSTYKIHPIVAKTLIAEKYDMKSSQILSDMFSRRYTKVNRGNYHQITNEISKSILLEYVDGLLGNSKDYSQSFLAAKYQCSQGTVNRTIKNTSYRYANIFVEELEKGCSFVDITKNHEFMSPNHVKMTILYAFQRMTSDDISYYSLAKKYGILDFAKTLIGTPAQRYSV